MKVVVAARGKGLLQTRKKKEKVGSRGKKGDDRKLKLLVCGENIRLGCRGGYRLQDGWGWRLVSHDPWGAQLRQEAIAPAR